jgi:hypothetical protein
MLLVTTSKSLLLFDPECGEFKRVHNSGQHYYGATRDPEGLWLVGHRNRSNASSIPKEDERGEVLVFGPDLALQHTLQPRFALRDIHQLLWAEGALYVTCPYDDAVAVYAGEWRVWHPLGPPGGLPSDVHHFNSLATISGDLWLVAHNWERASLLLRFALPNPGEPIERIEIGRQCHNVWRHGAELMTCSSGEGRILGVNGTEIETGGFPRGVAYLNDRIYVGLSQFKTRDDRDNSRGAILAFDMSWRLLRRYDLGNEGMVTDLQAFEPAAAAIA